MWVLEAILLVVLPYGTAIVCGAITEGAGRIRVWILFIGWAGPRHLFLQQMHGGSCGGLNTRDHCASDLTGFQDPRMTVGKLLRTTHTSHW